jgi:predicted aspartyl protease
VTRIVAVVVVALLALAAPVAAQVYRWTDDDGVMHLTTDPSRIPAKHRDRVEVLDASPRAAPAEPPPSGHVVEVTAGAAIYADATLNGVALRLLIDTGASRTVIAPTALSRAGLDPAQGRPASMIGVGGAVHAVEVSVPRLDVAGAQIGPLRVIAHEVAGLRGDGLLGRDVLEHFTLTIDPVRGRATLSR